MKLNAAVFTGSRVRVEEVELLGPRPHDVVVRIEASNVAHGDAVISRVFTDLPFPGAGDGPAPDLGGGSPPVMPMPLVLGHAAVGRVEEVGPAVERVKVGDRVLATSTANCGVCFYCQRDRFDQCAEMVPVGPAHARTQDETPVYPFMSVGSFAELAVVPETQLTAVTTDLPADQLALIANPVCTGVGAALRTAPIRPGSVVAVLGCGPVGLSYIQGARLALADQIIAIDPLPHRRDAALRSGATTVIDPVRTDPAEAVRELAGDAGGPMQGRGADYVFEATTDARAAEQAWAMARTTGHVVVSGLDAAPGATVTFSAMQLMFGKTLHHCQQGSLLQRRDLPWIIRLAERGQLDLAGMAERSYALKAIDDALGDVIECAVLGATLLPGA